MILRFIKTTLQNKTYLTLIFLTLIGLFFRIHNLKYNLHFSYDQGRDALAITSMIENKKPLLIGPTTAIQGVFIGPAYYYLLAPFYLIDYGYPYYPALAMAIFAAFGIPLIYLLAKDIFDEKVGLLSALFLTFSSYAIKFSRMLYNPSPLIPLSLLIFWLTYKSTHKKPQLLPLVGLLVGLSLQTELANAFFLAIALTIFVFLNLKSYKPRHIILAIILFLTTLIPQITFELRHDFLVTNSIINNMINDPNRTSLQVVWQQRPPFILQWLTNSSGIRGSFIKNYTILSALIFATLTVIIPLITIPKSSPKRKGLILLLLWLYLPSIFYLFITGNYGQFFDNYLVSLFLPLTILTSYLIIEIKNKKQKHSHTTATIIATVIITLNFLRSETFINPKDYEFSFLKLNQSVSHVLNHITDEEVVVAKPPNGIPASYQYVFNWRTNKQNLPSITLVDHPGDKPFYLIYEPDSFEKRFNSWYPPLVEGKTLLDEQSFGLIKVEHYSQEEIVPPPSTTSP